LLENAKVYMTPGLVETIVEGSTSTQVHETIASKRELHSGNINNRVPLALLKSQVKISTALIKKLIHPTIISFTDMKVLYRSRESLRADVVAELYNFLKQAYAL
jgi:hypothetical protein